MAAARVPGTGVMMALFPAIRLLTLLGPAALAAGRAVPAPGRAVRVHVAGGVPGHHL
jgi:hypothetical protein